MNLQSIFDELCKGNINIITLEAQKYISDMAMTLYSNDAKTYAGNYAEDLKYLILICNLLYNRTSTTVLPVEDGMYDILLEKYKVIDPHFQVGSAVVQFKEIAEKSLAHEGRKIIQPIIFLNEKKDELREYFEREITKYDLQDVYNFNDLFCNNPIYSPEANITKRVHNTAHNHPQLVGTLDKCKFVLNADAIEKDVFNDDNVKVLERDWFGKHISQGIIDPNQNIDLMLELKYDGISVEADCTDEVISARTRGDTGAGQAADITPLLKGYKFTRNDALKDRVVGVKFEAIMTKENLYRFNMERGYNYANCRTAIVGLFGASDGWKYRDYITLVPLALDRDNVPEVTNRLEEVELLNRLYKTKGQPLRYCTISGTYANCLYLIKKYAEEAVCARSYLNFMFDGIVVSYTDEKIRAKLGRENFINKYQMAVKFDPLTKLTTFLGYTYEVGQNGAICPMIHYAPIEFFGTIHDKSTGSSYKRFMDLGLKEGDVIQVTYNNDVMPYVTALDCEQNRTNPNPPVQFPEVCPVCGAPIIVSPTSKTALCTNINCDGRRVARMINMLQKLGIKGFAEATVYQLNIHSLTELFNLTDDQLSILGPTNAQTLRSILNDLTQSPIEEYKIIGSLGFTNIAQKTWKIIFSKLTLPEFIGLMKNDKAKLEETLISLSGIGGSTISTIFAEYKYFEQDIYLVNKTFNIIPSRDVKFSGKVIRFSGCRDGELEKYLQSLGHDADGSASVTKTTDILLIPYDGYTSGKTSKMSDNGMIITIQDFKENMDKYL